MYAFLGKRHIVPLREEVNLDGDYLREQRGLIDYRALYNVFEPRKLLNHLLFLLRFCCGGAQIVLLDKVSDGNAHGKE